MPVSFGASRYRGGAAASDPYTTLENAFSAGRLFGFWHVGKNLVSSAGALVSWDDARGGSGYGPRMLPNGGLGGTAPTWDGNTINTDGAASFVSHSAAQAAFALKNTALTWVLWGELLGTPNYWGGVIDNIASGSDYLILQPDGTQIRLAGGATPESPKVQPGAGVRSLLLSARNTKYPWDTNALYYTGQRFEWVGRATAWYSTGTEPAATTGFLSLGRAYSYYGQLKLRGIIAVAGTITPAERNAIETFVTDATVGDSVSLYGASDSTGMVLCIGDSLTYGAGASSQSQTTPVSATATAYPSKVQALINGASKAIDVVNVAVSSRTINEFVNTSTYFRDMIAACSAARRAAGKKEVVVLWIGTNDIAGGRTASQIETNIGTAISQAQAAGTKIAVATIIPRTGFYGGANETTRLAVNTWIKGSGCGADLKLDLSQVTDGATHFLADPSGGSDTITSNATYYNADGIHLTDLGYGDVGTYVYNQLVAAALI